MFGYDFPSFSYVAVADRLAGRHNLLCHTGAYALLGATDSPPRRIGGSPNAHETALDGDFLGSDFSDQFDDLLAIDKRRGSAVCGAASADLFHAGADLGFAIRHFTKTGRSASFYGRNRFCCGDESCPCSI